jgi:hypothetical protein
VPKSRTLPEIVTSGLVLPDGAMLEQLAGNQLLLAMDGREEIGASIEHEGTRFVPLPLDKGYEEALKLPAQTAPYGSVDALIKGVASAVQGNTGLNAQQSLLVAAFVLASWVSEFLPVPPVLNLWGQAGMETALLCVLRSLCRRPLALIDPSLRQLSLIPQGLVPTIFLRRPSDAAFRRFLSISSDQDVLCGDHFLQICSPIVVFTAQPVSVPALRLRLATSGAPYRRISQPQIQELRHIQRQLLTYRLTRHQQVAGSCFDVPRFGHETRITASILAACVAGDESMQQAIRAALQEHDDTAKAASSQGADAVVLEALLVLLHEGSTEAYVGEIARLANAVLFGRQANTKLSLQDVGGIIREGLGLFTRRMSQGVQLRLDSAAAAVIHREAYSRGVLSLLAPRADCEFCREVVRTAKSSLAHKSHPPRVSSTPSTPSALLHPSEDSDADAHEPVNDSFMTEKRITENKRYLLHRLGAAGCPVNWREVEFPREPLEIFRAPAALGTDLFPLAGRGDRTGVAVHVQIRASAPITITGFEVEADWLHGEAEFWFDRCEKHGTYCFHGCCNGDVRIAMNGLLNDKLFSNLRLQEGEKVSGYLVFTIPEVVPLDNWRLEGTVWFYDEFGKQHPCRITFMNSQKIKGEGDSYIRFVSAAELEGKGRRTLMSKERKPRSTRRTLRRSKN